MMLYHYVSSSAQLFFNIKNAPAKHQPGLLQNLTNYSFGRTLTVKLLKSQVAKKINKNHYPAPFAVLDLWEKIGGNLSKDAYIKEAESVQRLVSQNETASNLIRIFLLRERLKSFAKASNFTAKHVHVIGAGIMGGDIAAWCAFRGLKVTLQDQSYAQTAPAIGRANELFKKRLREPRLIQQAMDRLVPDPEGFGMAQADVIIEAVFENLEMKRSLLKEIESKAQPAAIIATNTSSIPLDQMNDRMKHPERLVGIHFFNPVAKMDLVEIVAGAQTLESVQADAAAFVNQIGKLPLPVKSSPGFLVNRILMPYLMECVQLLSENHSPEAIDQSAKDFGMFMGPVELADTVGLDVCLAVANNLVAYFGGSVPNKLKEMVQAGKLGRKTGEGFYRYKNGKPIKQNIVDGKNTDIADRLILRMINEAASCLREGVVADADLLDAGMVFGAGFAPFRGGPMHYAQQFGKDKLNQVFAKLETQYGERFKVDTYL